MSSTGETPSDIPVKPNPYTEQSFTYITEALVKNLSFIHDNGKEIETAKFFDLCIEGIYELGKQGRLPGRIVLEIVTWFKRRQYKIGGRQGNYEDTKRLFREFLEDYYRFFGLDKAKKIDGLSGEVQTIVNGIIEEYGKEVNNKKKRT